MRTFHDAEYPGTNLTVAPREDDKFPGAIWVFATDDDGHMVPVMLTDYQLHLFMRELHRAQEMTPARRRRKRWWRK